MSYWSLYILECKDGSLYTGITTNLSQRLKRHNKGDACTYTRTKRPVRVIYKELLADESSARKREIEIKKLSRENKLKLIRNFESLAAKRDKRRLGTIYNSEKQW